MNEIRSRGTEDIVLLAVVDGLKAARRHPRRVRRSSGPRVQEGHGFRVMEGKPLVRL